MLTQPLVILVVHTTDISTDPYLDTHCFPWPDWVPGTTPLYSTLSVGWSAEWGDLGKCRSGLYIGCVPHTRYGSLGLGLRQGGHGAPKIISASILFYFCCRYATDNNIGFLFPTFHGWLHSVLFTLPPPVSDTVDTCDIKFVSHYLFQGLIEVDSATSFELAAHVLQASYGDYTE